MKRLYPSREANLSYIQQLKSNTPCADCGRTFPAVCMDFDHLGDKKFSVANGIVYSRPRLQAEIDKCEIVCANCHRIRTQNRRVEPSIAVTLSL